MDTTILSALCMVLLVTCFLLLYLLHRYRAAPPKITEADIERAFWDFDVERKRTGAERDAFKSHVRALVSRSSVPAAPLTAIVTLVGLGLVCCTPAQRAASDQAAKAWAADFGKCEVTTVPQATINTVASNITSTELWKTAGLGAAGHTLTCALLALIGQQSQGEAPPGGEAGVAARRSALQVDPVAQVEQLAQRCAAGPCSDPRERAAWRLKHGGGR